MSVAAIERSPFNPIAFYAEDLPRLPQYNTVLPGTDWHIKSIPKGQQKINYYYKAQTTDQIQLQFHLFAPSTLALVLMDRMGNQVYDFSSAMQSAFLTGNVLQTQGLSLYLMTYHFKFSFSQVPALKQGLYYLRLVGAYGTGPINMLSEPIFIRDKHPGTILIENSHKKNEFNTVFTAFNASFGFRVEGAVHGLPKLLSTDTDAQDSSERVHSTYSAPQHTRNLTVGGGRGLPEWALLRANYAVRTSSIRIEGRQYVRDLSAKWDMIEPDAAYPLGGARIAVREANPTEIYTTIVWTPLPLWTRRMVGGIVQPYALLAIGMTNGTGTLYIKDASGNTIIGVYDNAGETALLNYLNGAFASQNNLSGHFGFSGNTLNYYNSYGEGYYTPSGTVYPKAFRFQVQRNIISPTLTLTYTATDALVGWDTGDAPTILATLATPPLASVSNVYKPSAKVRTAHIFHNDSVTVVNSTTTYIIGVAGDCPATLTKMDLQGTNMASFDATVLAPCKAAMQQLKIHGGQLSSLKNLSQVAGPAATAFDFTSNKLPVADVDNALIDFRAGVTLATAGSFLIIGQTPSAPPTSASSAAKATLIVNGWTVTTD